MTLVLLLNIKGARHLFQLDTAKFSKANSILETAQEQGADGIYVYDDTSGISHIIRTLDLNVCSLGVTYTDGICTVSRGDFYDYYRDNYYGGSGRNLLVSSQENFDSLPIYIKGNYTLLEELGDGSNIYYAEKNPWDGMTGLPETVGKTYADLPYSNGCYWNGTYDETGIPIGNETEEDGYILNGPYTSTAGGIYNITLSYHILQEGSEAIRFEIAMSDSETGIVNQELSVDESELTLTNVMIPEGNSIEVKIWKPKDAVISVDYVSYEKIE